MTPTSPPAPADRLTLALRWVLGVGAALLLLGAAVLAYAYLGTPAALRHPVGTHYHFRMQIIAQGHAVDFADATYQTQFNKDICTAKLTKEPFHFHDNLDQFTHVHWGHLTGGLLLKNYGWNFIGGANNTLGYRFDQFPRVTRIAIHGRALPAVPKDTKYYVYTGDQNTYHERNWNDFLHQDLEKFFGSQPMASMAMNMDMSAPSASHEEQLTMLNHVLGNVVIFAQTAPPTADQVKDRFAHLIPLPETVCGG